jgi:DNA-binding MarR family transcriptional regulator
MPSHGLAMALRLAYLAVHRRMDAVMSVHSVVADQFIVLKTISDNEGVSQKELAEKVGCDRNTLRAMLVLLEQRGNVCRQVDVSHGH